jgi:hypothetical protein
VYLCLPLVTVLRQGSSYVEMADSPIVHIHYIHDIAAAVAVAIRIMTLSANSVCIAHTYLTYVLHAASNTQQYSTNFRADICEQQYQHEQSNNGLAYP